MATAARIFRRLAVGDDGHDDDTAASSALHLDAAQQQLLQAFVLIACSLSFIALTFVILHYLWERYGRCCGSFLLCIIDPRGRRRQYHSAAATTKGVDFNSQLVFILGWIDLASILARMVGRALLAEHTWCVVQAAAIHAFGLASCLWTTCMSFNLYRWIVYGESDKKRRSRMLPFLLVTIVPSALLTIYPLRQHKYGNATFYCWIIEPLLMFVHFYVYYVLLAVANIALLLLIRANLKLRVQWHDSEGTDATAAVIRRKALHYIVIFLLHRMPILLYRALQTLGVQAFPMAVAVQFILNLDGFSNAVVYGGLFKKIPGVKYKFSPTADPTPLRSSSEDFDVGSGSLDTDDYFTKRFKGTGALSIVAEELGERTTDTSASSLSAATYHLNSHSSAPRAADGHTFALVSPKSQQQPSSGFPRVSKKRRFAAGILERASIELGSDREVRRAQQHQQHQQPRPRSQSFSIFVSTFNMGEQNISEGQLVEWIPIGHEIYVIGVQECMNLGDLQTKVLNHLIANTKQRYIHFSREIGKRATALGYHGYISLTVFVLEEAILEGRFEMPQRHAMSKHAQEVYRGKSLLLFGRASNKGAVGISFRYNSTSFAFVTCHLASDSAGSAKKLSFRNKPQPADSAAVSNSIDSTSSSIDSSDGTSSSGRRPNAKKLPSKIERRNQDAMEILQQLHLDEEDYGFGFPLLHHHSFVLGDLNYRMTRQYALPSEMLDMLTQVGAFKSKSTATTARSSSGTSGPHVALSTGPLRLQHDLYEEATTPTMMRHLPDLPAAMTTLIHNHDELTMLRESCQLFYGFEEPTITFFPTFRRIRGEQLETSDAESFRRNYSLQASGGGLRVPSYTDRIMHSSLPGRKQQVQCLYYDSCESVTSSDHKPVCAVYRVGPAMEDELDAVDARTPPQRMMPRMPSLFGSAPVLRRKNSAESACDVSLKVEFRSIQWMDALDNGVGNLFSRLENVEVGFLFPLPCEDVMTQQRKLQEVAENLNWGESIEMPTPLPFSNSPTSANKAAASPNFHLASWNTFVEQGLRYQTRVQPTGKKHVALLIRTRSRSIQRSASSSRSRSRNGSAAATSVGGGGGAGAGPGGGMQSSSLNSSGGHSRRSSASSNVSTATRSFTSSSSYELNLGHGVFCIDKIGKRQDTVVPLTTGGNLVGRLHLRVILQARHRE